MLDISVALQALRFRLQLCNRVLSKTNMVMAYSRLEDIFVWHYQNQKINDVNEKDLVRFDKLKNLALGNPSINERKLAFDRSIELMDKILGGVITK